MSDSTTQSASSSAESKKAENVGGTLAVFSQTRRFGDLVFTSGQGPVNMPSGIYSPLSLEDETKLTLDNLKTVLEQAGSSMDRVLKVTIYLADMNDYAAFNRIYMEYFESPMPARSCIAAAKLAFGMKIELDAVASAAG